MKIDIQSQNFDYYFYNQLASVSNESKQLLPVNITRLLWRRDNGVSKKSTKYLNIIHRLFVLWKAARKDIFIVVIDEEKGLGPEDFVKWAKANRKKDYSKDTAEELTGNAMFVLGNKQLGETLSFLNHASHAPMYNYVAKVEGLPENKSKMFERNMKFIARLFMNWEAKKRSWSTMFSISMSEFYVLVTLYVEGEMVGAIIYNQLFKGAFNSGITKIKVAFSTLQIRGLIEKLGEGRGATMRLTGLGVEMVNNILSRYGTI